MSTPTIQAFVEDAEAVKRYLQWASGIPRGSEQWHAERQMADHFLALLEAKDRQLAEPPQRALEWEMARQIEALEVKLAAREAALVALQAERDELQRKLDLKEQPK